jgi:hypothetical protein
MGAHTFSPKISLRTLAKRWGWHPSRLYRLCAAKKIPHLRIGRDLFFEEPVLEQWLEERRQVDTTRQAEAKREKRRSTRTIEEECAALGIPVDHQFT